MAGKVLIAQGVERRRAIMKFIKAYIKRNHFPPSIDEIAAGVDGSKTAVRYHIGILIDEKFLSMTEGRYRSLRVIKDGRYPA